MLQALVYALPLGITLSFAAGPIFFVIIETSISEGRTKAFMLDLGAIVADSIFILVAFYGSQSLISTLRNNIWVALISGLAVVGFGAYYVFKSGISGQFQNKQGVGKKRHFFLKGFLLNFLNIGVLFYWIATTLAIGPLLDHEPNKMLTFYLSVILSYLLVDVFKIYFANKFKERLRGRKIQVVEKILGIILILFGIYIIIHNLFHITLPF